MGALHFSPRISCVRAASVRGHQPRDGRYWRSAVSSILFSARSTHSCAEASMCFARLCRCHCFHRTEAWSVLGLDLESRNGVRRSHRNHRSHKRRNRERHPFCCSRSGCSDWLHAHHLHNLGNSWIPNRPIPEVDSRRCTRRGLQCRYLYAHRRGSRFHRSVFACSA